MADTIAPAHPFGELLQPVVHGRASAAAGVSIRHVPYRTMAELAVFDGHGGVIEKATKTAERAAGDARIMRHGPARAFVFSREADLLRDLQKAIDPAQGAVIDQSHGRVALSIAGSRVEDVLSKLFAVDFHPSAFRPGTGIATAHHVIFALVWRESETDFMLFAHRSFARAFLGDLIRAGEEYGLAIQA